MPKIGIVTDSSSCLPQELADKYGILVTPTRLIIGRKDYRDLKDITPAEFWKEFRELDGQATTAAVNPGDFIEAFETLAATNDNIICFVVSARLSATFQSALQAKELIGQDLPNLKIEVVDSKSSVGGLSFIALEAARAAQSGQNLDEVLAESQKMIARVKYFLVLESPRYLAKIGRAPRETNQVNENSVVSPIMGIVKGTGLVDMLGSGIGIEDAKQKAVDMIRQFADIEKPLHVMLHYCESQVEVKDLEISITRQFRCDELYFSQFSPVVVAAIGPAVAISFYS